VGGALTDCWIYEEGFNIGRGPLVHLYGSSEDGTRCDCLTLEIRLNSARRRGFFQTLSLGKTYPLYKIRARKRRRFGVTGPHVCPQYLGNAEEITLQTQRSSKGTSGTSWGIASSEDGDGWWYGGRSGQLASDFELRTENLYLL